jgi:hypothetical protein
MKFFDIFGTTFQFTIFKSEKFRTIIGSILTLISLGIILVFSFFFGSDFYYKLNPKILTETQEPEIYPPAFELSPENLVLAWRIADNNDVPIDHHGKIYPVITYYDLHFNSSEKSKDRVEVMAVKKCNDKNVKMKEFAFPKDDWNCLDWSSGNYSFGGNWLANSINYFEMIIYYCPDGKPFAPENNCTDINTMQKLVANNNFFIELAYPNFYFVPSDINEPLKLTYSMYYFAVGLTMQKTDRIFFQQIDLEDDKGWIIKYPELSTKYSMNKLTTDYSYFDVNNYGHSKFSSDFYHLNIYFQKQKIVIKRSFMKVQDFAAVMGGFIKIVTLIAMTISNFFNFVEREEKIFNQFFQLKRSTIKKPDEKRVIREKTPQQLFNVYNLKNQERQIIETPKLKTLKFIDTSKSMIQEDDGVIYNINNDKCNLSSIIKTKYNNDKIADISLNKNSINCNKKDLDFKIANQSQLSATTLKRRKSSLNLFSNFKMKNNQINSIQFGLCFRIKHRICTRKYIDKSTFKVHDYLIRYFTDRLDVIHYLKTLNVVHRMRIVLFNYYQNLSFDYVKTPNLACKSDIDSLELYSDILKDTKFNQLIDYYTDKKIKNKMTRHDELLFKMLDPEVTNKVEKILLK